jgi:hypothetical protein
MAPPASVAAAAASDRLGSAELAASIEWEATAAASYQIKDLGFRV